MKVLFSPEFQGHVFLCLNKKNTCLMDTMVCDTMKLIGMLELHMGIHVPDQPGHYRMVKYFKAMSEYMKQYPDNALAASFELSNLGTAEQALRWRDHLLLDKWQPAESAAISAAAKIVFLIIVYTFLFLRCKGNDTIISMQSPFMWIFAPLTA